MSRNTFHSDHSAGDTLSRCDQVLALLQHAVCVCDEGDPFNENERMGAYFVFDAVRNTLHDLSEEVDKVRPIDLAKAQGG